MSKTYFLSLPDWHTLRDDIEKQVERFRNELLGEIAEAHVNLGRTWGAREYARGWHDALKSVLELPEQLLKDTDGEEEKPEPQQSPDAKRIVPEHNGVTPRASKLF